MDGLRLALIISGIVVVAVVYFWTARRRRLDREAGDFDRFDAWTDTKLDPLAAAPITIDGAGGQSDGGLEDRVADDVRQADRRTSADRAGGQTIADERDGTDRVGSKHEPRARGGARSAASPALDAASPRAERAAPQHAADSAREHGSMEQIDALDDGDVIDDLEAIADSLDMRAEPQIGSLDDIELHDSPSRPTFRSSSVGRESDAAPRAADERPGGHAESDPGTALVVVLNVMAREGSTIDGPLLKRALEGAGLKPGEMKLYHYRAETQAADNLPIFSALNAVKPGTLAESEFDGMRTPGIALVLRVAGLERPSECFELMLVAARRIAGELHAQVCDDTRSTLTGQALNHLREQIAAAALRARR